MMVNLGSEHTALKIGDVSTTLEVLCEQSTIIFIVLPIPIVLPSAHSSDVNLSSATLLDFIPYELILSVFNSKHPSWSAILFIIEAVALTSVAMKISVYQYSYCSVIFNVNHD